MRNGTCATARSCELLLVGTVLFLAGPRCIGDHTEHPSLTRCLERCLLLCAGEAEVSSTKPRCCKLLSCPYASVWKCCHVHRWPVYRASLANLPINDVFWANIPSPDRCVSVPLVQAALWSLCALNTAGVSSSFMVSFSDLLVCEVHVPWKCLWILIVHSLVTLFLKQSLSLSLSLLEPYCVGLGRETRITWGIIARLVLKDLPPSEVKLNHSHQ